MSNPGSPRMPPPNRLAYPVAILFVVACLVISSHQQVGLGFVALIWTANAVLLTWHSPIGRSVRRRILASSLRLRTPAAITALQTKWSAQDIAAIEVATPGEIAAFEQETDLVMPRDLRHYFRLVNGTKVGECGKDDEYEVGFWQLKHVRSFAQTHVSAGPEASRTVAFADRSIRTAVYGVRLSSDPTEGTPVLASLPSGRVQVAASFTEFVDRYPFYPRSVLWPDLDVVAMDEGIGAEYNGTTTCSIRWEDVKAISIVLVPDDDGTVRAAWLVAGDEPASPLHTLFVPVVLSARPSGLTDRLRALPGFDEDRFRAAVAAEDRDEPGTFVCWRHPDFRDELVDADTDVDRDRLSNATRTRRLRAR